MLERIRAQLTYANVVATVALSLALLGSMMVARNVVDRSSSANSAGATWFLAGSVNELPSCTRCEVSLPASGSAWFGSTLNSVVSGFGAGAGPVHPVGAWAGSQLSILKGERYGIVDAHGLRKAFHRACRGEIDGASELDAAIRKDY